MYCIVILSWLDSLSLKDKKGNMKKVGDTAPNNLVLFFN